MSDQCRLIRIKINAYNSKIRVDQMQANFNTNQTAHTRHQTAPAPIVTWWFDEDRIKLQWILTPNTNEISKLRDQVSELEKSYVILRFVSVN